MARTSWAVASHRRVKRTLKKAKGYRGGRRKLLHTAKETIRRAQVYATRDRKVRKREFRRLWITRLNAACRQHGLSYSRFVQGLKAANVKLDRKVLAELAVHDAPVFEQLLALSTSLRAGPERPRGVEGLMLAKKPAA